MNPPREKESWLMEEELIVLDQNTPLADSRAIAQMLGLDHHSFLDHIAAYQHEIERRFGLVRFEIERDPESLTEYYALLTENQALIYLSYSQHPRAKACKQRIGRAFSDVSEQIVRGERLHPYSSTSWITFLEAWYLLFGSQQLPASSIEDGLRRSREFAATLPEPLTTSFFSNRPGSSFAICLGRALSRYKDTPFGARKLIIQRGYDAHLRISLWSIVIEQ